MISLQHLLANPDLYEKELERRFKDTSLVANLIGYYNDWKEKQTQLDSLRAEKNKFNKEVISLVEEQKQSAIEKMKDVSERIKILEGETRELKKAIDDLLSKIPNLTWSGIPIGPDDGANIETAVYGNKPEFDFPVKNYYELPVFLRDYLSEKGVEAAGFRGYYMKGELAKFQKCLFDWVLEQLFLEGFEYVYPPIMVNEEVLVGTGFFPTGREDVYEATEGDKTKFLVGTSEAPLMFLYSNQELDLTTPKKLTAWTTCFRKEIGSYGKDLKGGIRVHQFEKIETVYLCKPEDSDKVFEEMTTSFRVKLDKLGLYYHDLEVSTGDISIKNRRQIDIEAWFPAQNQFRELASSSNCSDYQTNTLKITVKGSHKEIAHSLNCTGVVARTMFAILEQFQTIDGRVKIPDVLVDRFGKEYLE